jgi:hypothetical protein
MLKNLIPQKAKLIHQSKSLYFVILNKFLIIIETTTIHNISNFEIGIDYGFCFFVFEDLKKKKNLNSEKHCFEKNNYYEFQLSPCTFHHIIIAHI